jgi:4-hydroxy-tetrahydrodipicolinate reductase
MIRVCVAGITGWVGRSLVPAIAAAPDLELTGAVARTAAGQRVADALQLPELGAVVGDVVVRGTVEEALRAGADVLIDYTAPEVVKGNVLHAIARRVHVVIGTSGLTDADYEEIAEAAERAGVGVLATANFAISAVLMEELALIAARFMPSWEVIDYSNANKPDAPSGTARQLAFRLAGVRAPEVAVPIHATHGAPEARGLTLNGTQVHAIRLPGHTIGAEALFGMPDERLSIRYDGGSGAEPYVAGTLLATRTVGSQIGLRRGLGPLLGIGTSHRA